MDTISPFLAASSLERGRGVSLFRQHLKFWWSCFRLNGFIYCIFFHICMRVIAHRKRQAMVPPPPTPSFVLCDATGLDQTQIPPLFAARVGGGGARQGS